MKSELATIDTPDTKAEGAAVSAIVQQAQAITIQSDADNVNAVTFLRTIKTRLEQVTALFREPKAKADEAKKSLLAAENALKNPLLDAERTIKLKCSDWAIAQERARVKAEQEARAAAQKAEEERRLAEAEALEKSGEKERAEQVIAAPVVAPTIVIPKAKPVAGTSFRDNWKCRIVDPNAVPREWCKPDESALDKFAKATKGEQKIAGVEFYCEKAMSSRGL